MYVYMICTRCYLYIFIPVVSTCKNNPSGTSHFLRGSFNPHENKKAHDDDDICNFKYLVDYRTVYLHGTACAGMNTGTYLLLR